MLRKHHTVLRIWDAFCAAVQNPATLVSHSWHSPGWKLWQHMLAVQKCTLLGWNQFCDVFSRNPSQSEALRCGWMCVLFGAEMCVCACLFPVAGAQRECVSNHWTYVICVCVWQEWGRSSTDGCFVLGAPTVSVPAWTVFDGRLLAVTQTGSQLLCAVGAVCVYVCVWVCTLTHTDAPWQSKYSKTFKDHLFCCDGDPRFTCLTQTYTWSHDQLTGHADWPNGFCRPCSFLYYWLRSAVCWPPGSFIHTFNHVFPP